MSISTISVLFDYEIEYDEAYEDKLNSLLSNVEQALGNTIIANTTSECSLERRYEVRRILKNKQSGVIVGSSSKPADVILPGKNVGTS